MRLLTFRDFLDEPDGILFQTVMRRSAPGPLLMRGRVTRHDEYARYIASGLSIDESPNGPRYEWPPMNHAATFRYDERRVQYIVLDDEDVQTLRRFIDLRSEPTICDAYESGLYLEHPHGWPQAEMACFSALPGTID